MRIRRAKAADARRISNLIGKVTDENPQSYSAVQKIAWQKFNTPHQVRGQIKERVVFVAFNGRRLIGTIALKGSEIVGFYTYPRGSGTGSKLLSHLEMSEIALTQPTGFSP